MRRLNARLVEGVSAARRLAGDSLIPLELHDEAWAVVRSWEDGFEFRDIDLLEDPRPLLWAIRRRLAPTPKESFVIASSPNFPREAGITPKRVSWLLSLAGLSGDLVVSGNQHWAAKVTVKQPATDTGLGIHTDLVTRIIFTTEFPVSGSGRTGGIGGYCYSSVESSPAGSTLIVTYQNPLPESGLINGSGQRIGFSARGLAGYPPDYEPTWEEWPDVILEAALNSVLMFPNLQQLEYQDYGGMCYRLGQGRRALLFPKEILTVCVAHGNHYYLDRAADNMHFERDTSVDVWERLSIEEADLVVFPSEYLQSLYLDELGYQVSTSRRMIYQNSLSARPHSLTRSSFQHCRRLVFVGKETVQKGFFLFLDALREMHHQSLLPSDTEVVFLGISNLGEASTPPYPYRLWSGGRPEYLEQLELLASDSLFILPYLGDNQPLAVTEVMLTGGLLVCVRAGGVPEMFPDHLQSLLADPTPNGLADVIARLFSLSPKSIAETKEQLIQAAEDRSKRAQQDALQLRSFSPLPIYSGSHVLSNFTVIIPAHNPDLIELRSAVDSVIALGKLVSEVIVVDDGSDSGVAQRIEQLVAEIRWEGLIRLIRLENNQGLANARFVGVNQSTNELVIFLDADDLLVYDFALRSALMFAREPKTAAVTSFSAYFSEDGEVQGTYRPIGSDLGLGLQQNVFGHAAIAARRDRVLEVMTPDWSQARAQWEDWALLLKLALNGHQLLLIPRPELLYRVRPDSMSRTFSTIPGYLRLADALNIFPANMRWGVIRALGHQQTQAFPPIAGYRHLLKMVRFAMRSGRLRRAFRVLRWKDFLRELLRRG